MQKQILAFALLGITILSVGLLLSKNDSNPAKTKMQMMAEKINSNPNATWRAEQNPKEADIEMRKKMFNLMIDEVPAGFDTQPESLIRVSDLPPQFDSREHWPNCESIKEIRDQSGCGSCWAFGAASAMSDRICIASGQKDQRRVSTEDLLECCYQCGLGCNGGFLFQTWMQWKEFGVVTGGLYQDKNWCKAYKFPPCNHHSSGPYEDCSKYNFNTPKCEKACSNSDYKKSYADDKTFAQKIYNVVGGEQAMMQEIFAYGPVEAAFMVYDDFLAYKSGVYAHMEGDFLGGHAIKIIGWGVEGKTPYWLVVNSWNDNWGDRGTFKILRGRNHCGIEGSPVAGIPKL